MDDDLLKLEAELKRLRPAAPTRDFLARIERELATPIAPPAAAPVRRPAPLWWLWAGALPAAAALAVMVTLAARNRSPSAAPKPVAAPIAAVEKPTVAEQLVAESTAAFKPIAAENVLYAARDEGLVTLADGTPARRERLNYVDTFVWKDPRTNASVRWTVPREEVHVVPVKFQ
jgi:hypothetical protein